MKVRECFTNNFYLPQRKQERTLSLWKHSLCFHGATIHEMIRLGHQQRVSLSHGELRQKWAGNSKQCWDWGFLSKLLLLCSPEYSSINPQTTWISSCTLLYSSDSASKAFSAALLAALSYPGHISVSVPGLAAFKLNTEQGSFNLIWWPHYTT